MKPRSLASLGLLLLLAAATWAQSPAPKSWQPKSPPAGRPAAPTTPTKRKEYYNGIPDTGQFLPDSAVIARVDGRPIRVFDFRDRWFAAYPPDLPQPDSAGRVSFLQSMVDRYVLADLAREVNRPLVFEDRQALREIEQRAKANAVFARLVADSVTVPEEMVQKAYAQYAYELHLQRVVTDDRASAERARADVVSGRLTWAAAVQKYTNARGAGSADGDMGWLTRAKLPPSAALEVFDLADGQLSRVFQAEQGWEFVRVLARRPGTQPLFALVQRSLENEIRGIQLSRRTAEVRAGVGRSIGLAHDSTAIAYAAERFAALAQESQGAPGEVVVDVSGSTPEFQTGDTARVLATWDGGRITLGGFLSEYTALTPLARPNVTSYEQFRDVLDGYVLEPFMARIADERGYDRDPIVLAMVGKKEEELRVGHLFTDSVEARVRVTPQARRRYYDQHPHDYVTYQAVTYAAIIRHSKEAADSLAARLMAGESGPAVLHADSLAGVISGSVKVTRENDNEPLWKLLAEELKPGGVTVLGPDKQKNYLVIQKLAHDQGHRLSFAEVENMVDESVQNIEAEKLLKALIARHRRGHRIVMHPELIMRIKPTRPGTD